MAAFVLVAGAVHAAPLVYEPFDYEADLVLDDVAATGANLSGDWTAGDLAQQKPVVAEPGLDSGSLIGAPTARGNRLDDTAGVTAAFASVAVDDDVIVGPGSEIYWSALLSFSDALNGNHLANVALRDTDSGDFLAFGETAVGVRTLRVETSTAATGGLVADGLSGAFADGDTFLMIGRYVNSATPDGDSLDLLAYHTGDADVLPGVFDPADPNAELAFSIGGLDIDLGRIREISFTIRGTHDNAIDELRIGDSYASVLPEPQTALLLGAGLLLASGATPRRRS